jgi:hypothetical protein
LYIGGEGNADDERAKIEELRSLKRKRERERGRKGEDDKSKGGDRESKESATDHDDEDETASLRAEVGSYTADTPPETNSTDDMV